MLDETTLCAIIKVYAEKVAALEDVVDRQTEQLRTLCEENVNLRNAANTHPTTTAEQIRQKYIAGGFSTQGSPWIHAIKMVRQATGWGLKEARDFIGNCREGV